MTGTRIEKGGYPDMGSGRYTMSMGYKVWYEFALAQRTHLNLLENIHQVLACLLISGLVSPVAMAVTGAVYLLGRIGFTFSYKLHPAARARFAPFVMLPQVILPFYTMYACYELQTKSK